MKLLNYLNLAAVSAALMGGSAEGQFFPSMGAGESDTHTTLVIRTGGSCVLTNETVQSRKSLEMQVTSWERYSKMSEGMAPEDQDEVIPSPQPARPAQRPLTDEELASKLREMYQQRPELAEEALQKIEKLEISTNSVRVVTSRSFASIKELLGQNVYTWGPNVLMLEEARFETDTNRNLRITFTGPQTAGRMAKSMIRQWKTAKMKFEWKLVLPGKILNSSLPDTQGTATGINLDGEQPGTIDAAFKLVGSPVVITAESTGIKLDEPLESKQLARAARGQNRFELDLPITDAAPGFLAEPVSITLSTVHYFPEGEKYFKDRPEAQMIEPSSTGTMVSAKLFPPKGRVIRNVSGLRVKAAKDDQGRSISGSTEGVDFEENGGEITSFDSNGSDKSGAAHIELRMALPAPDAKAIDELQAEAVALTIGGWKEMVVTNVQADAKKEINLNEILPGAKLIIKKVGGRKAQKTIEASLEGPKEVGQLEMKVKLSSRRGGQSNMSDRRSTTSGNKTTRNVTIQAYEFEAGEEENAPLTLVIMYPQDIKRERVQFKLTTLDLL